MRRYICVLEFIDNSSSRHFLRIANICRQFNIEKRTVGWRRTMCYSRTYMTREVGSLPGLDVIRDVILPLPLEEHPFLPLFHTA